MNRVFARVATLTERRREQTDRERAVRDGLCILTAAVVLGIFNPPVGIMAVGAGLGNLAFSQLNP